MRYKADEIRHYNFTAQNKLFLDANIWLYLYGPPKRKSYWRFIYTSVFNRMLRAKSRLYTEICKNNGFTLITNDSDFKTQEIPILTANAKLL